LFEKLFHYVPHIAKLAEHLEYALNCHTM